MKAVGIFLSVIVFIWLLPGCYTARFHRELHQVNQIQNINPDRKYMKVHMKDGHLYVLHSWFVNKDTVSGYFDDNGENEKELSELQEGNMEAFKVKVEYAMFEEAFKLKLAGGFFRLPEKRGNEKSFGQEYDLSLTWQYNDYTKVSAFAGVFLPENGYKAVSGNTEKDPITLFGINGHVSF